MRRISSWYKHISSLLFLTAVFAVFGINMFEALDGHLHEEDSGLRTIVHGMESVDSVTYPFVNLNGLYQRILQRRYIYDADPSNDLVITKEKQLVSVSSPVSDKELEASAQELRESADWLAAREIPLVYVQAYTKMCLSEDDTMPGLKNYSYGKVERFLEYLHKKGIDYIDAREIINKPAADVFYKTDHHWKNDACFELMGGIYNHLNNNYDFQINKDYYDSGNYSFELHKDAFLGAEGRRTGIYAVGLDDFLEIKPLFDTSFNVEISDKDAQSTSRSGSFEDAIMDRSKDLGQYSFEDSAYYTYWGGDYGRVHITNNKAIDEKKVLIIKDSYAIPVTALMTPAFSSMDIIDVRYYNDDKSIKEIITEEKPDAVIYIYGIGYLTEKNMFKL